MDDRYYPSVCHQRLCHRQEGNASFIGEDYFERLLAEIREIRLSERRFYQKLTDIYATSIDYNANAPTTKLFFQKVQNKIHYAVHGHTAAELIVERADSPKEYMGRLVSAVLDMAERVVRRHIPMTMENWANRIDIILEAGGDAVHENAGQISAEFAKQFAES